jgi:hypothetical protein
MSSKKKIKAYQKKWNKENSEYRRIRQQNKRHEIKKWLKQEVLLGKSCTKCQEDHPACLDFHHRDPSKKDMEIAKMAHGRCNKETILLEIAKCDILCSNCHRKYHWEQGN